MVSVTDPAAARVDTEVALNAFYKDFFRRSLFTFRITAGTASWVLCNVQLRGYCS